LEGIFYDLKKIAMDQLTAKQREAIVGIRVEGTGRISNIPPLCAPYDFGIDKTWWRTRGQDYPNHVVDFFTHGKLDGFESLEEDESDDPRLNEPDD
jgi:hypothetical protein